MLTAFYLQQKKIEKAESLKGLDKSTIIWIDLCSPNPQETADVQSMFEVDLPSLDDMREIET